MKRTLVAGMAAMVIAGSGIAGARNRDVIVPDRPPPVAPCGAVCGYAIRDQAFYPELGSNNVDGSADCPKGMMAVGGGAWVIGLQYDYDKVAIQSSTPLVDAPDVDSGWYVSAIEVNGGTKEAWGIWVHVICMHVDK